MMFNTLVKLFKKYETDVKYLIHLEKRYKLEFNIKGYDDRSFSVGINCYSNDYREEFLMRIWYEISSGIYTMNTPYYANGKRGIKSRFEFDLIKDLIEKEFIRLEFPAIEDYERRNVIMGWKNGKRVQFKDSPYRR